ncbi:ribosomal protein L23 [Lentisphaera araneosa HTCC2155]|jgi:large subunit ribosomal protein L23|uniref:Large ribosomal subunit protein uL23 n=1 Tax=Lentisphaera araneosa HTCC2155 TaxID=313628 RepID=A6DPN6_9BACT|nr:50S ribosomal protein L23 [Lentisphaera araneosa]EDM26331.1 ribosomal protein L23 [Lentisphaera araneosa HTCC2155]
MSNYKVIKTVVLTEKSSAAMEDQNKYTFKVASSANKIEIANAVQKIFNVKVQSVNTMNYTGKKKRQRTAMAGKKANWKKAIVTLKSGEIINLY